MPFTGTGEKKYTQLFQAHIITGCSENGIAETKSAAGAGYIQEIITDNAGYDKRCFI